MAFREFTDSEGMAWTVWDVRPGSTQILLAAADYPSEYYQTGWLSFQTRWGTDHRVLAPIPPGWETSPDARLLEFLARSTPTRRGRPTVSQELRVSTQPERPLSALDRDVTVRAPVVRAFLHPAGRAWTVSLAKPEQGGPPVLRFVSAGRSVDLTGWPDNWADLSDELLAELLRSVPRTGAPPGPHTPRRRWNDP